jgi:hypothetical protein
MNKKRIFLIVGLIGIVAGYFVWQNFLKTAPSMSRLDAEYRVNAADFYAEFEESEEAANTRYQNKIVEIVGEVEGVDSSDEGLPVITLKTDGFGTIKCTMESELSSDELSDIEINSTLIIRGECQGMLLDVLIGRSIVVEPS